MKFNEDTIRHPERGVHKMFPTVAAMLGEVCSCRRELCWRQLGLKTCKLYLLHVLWSVQILFEQTSYLKAVPHDTLYDRLDGEWFMYQSGQFLCSLHFWAIPGKTITECVRIANDSCSPGEYCEMQGICGFRILCFVNHYVYWEKHDTEMYAKSKISVSTYPHGPLIVVLTLQRGGI